MSETGRYELIIPGWNPTSVNRLLSRHPAIRGQIKHADAELIAMYALKLGIPRAEGKRRVSLVLQQRRGRMLDPDNVWKMVLDGLVACGQLRDDSGTWCELGKVTVEYGLQRRTVIVLEDLEK